MLQTVAEIQKVSINTALARMQYALRKLREELRAKLAEIRKKMEEARSRRRQSPPQAREGNERPVIRLMEYLRTQHPQEYQRMEKLQAEDPAAFLDALREKVESIRRRRAAAQEKSEKTDRATPAAGESER